MATLPSRDGHSSGTPVAGRLALPTRTAGPETGLGRSPRRPYSVLLPVGFTVPAPLPGPRWALTAPFHPYPEASLEGGLLSVALSLGLPPPEVIRHRCFHGARTFLPSGLSARCRSGRPAS